MVQIAVMGYGVVVSGVVEVLTTHTDHIAKRAKEEIGIKYILDLREFPDSPFADKFTKSFDDIVNDPEVRVVVEVMGGLHPAFEYTMRCIEAGKSVVTSNKELVATKGAEILKLAQEKNVNFLFEASVGGGIPIIRPISQCLAANDVIEIAGILNGTTNFILTKIKTNGIYTPTELSPPATMKPSGSFVSSPTAASFGEIITSKGFWETATASTPRHITTSIPTPFI